MKHIISCLALVLFLAPAYAQIPAGYYDRAEDLKGSALKDSLYQIIKGHTEYAYTSSSSTDVWDILKETDRDTANPDNVILFYTGWSVDAAQEYNSGSGWSREHVWAKSRGDFGTDKGPGTDAHHLRPADISVNSARNSRWFDECSVPYVDGDGETGCFTSSTAWVWEPRDAVKGDVARMLFYMATRYEGENGEPDLVLIDTIPSDDYTNEPVHALLSTLLKWHEADTVDSFERNRNEVVYSYQGNRNPFIDHPEWVNQIWGSDTSLTTIPTETTAQLTLYPNPAGEQFFVNTDVNIQSLSIFNTMGVLISRYSDEEWTQGIDISRLTPGSYVVQESLGEESAYQILIKNP